jgi:hypothetical protein
MKRFEIYRNIRKKALIWGLPISLFALMMVAVIASLLVIIFSFSFAVVIGVFVFNAGLYIGLTQIANISRYFEFSSVFPKNITNKKSSLFNYDQD